MRDVVCLDVSFSVLIRPICSVFCFVCLAQGSATFEADGTICAPSPTENTANSVLFEEKSVWVLFTSEGRMMLEVKFIYFI